MAQTWHGRMIFNSNTERDKYGKRIEDFIEARLTVVPHPDTAYTSDPSGVEYRNNLTIDVDSGPGFLWSTTIPDGSTALLAEAAAAGDDVSNNSLNGNHGFATVPD